MLKALGVLCSPRARSNTELLLDVVLGELSELGVSCEKLRLRELEVRPCTSCRSCVESGWCCLDDDMTRLIAPKLLGSQIIILASPVHFDNVSALAKAFMDRTWFLRGKLKDKVGGCVVVGRGYGLDSALTCIHNWMLKHRMILGDRGVMGIGFNYGEVLEDERALKDAKRHARRLYELAKLVHRVGSSTS